MDTQERLNAAYRRLVDKATVYECLGEGEATDAMLKALEGPFLVVTNERYETSTPKVIIVGKESDGWLGYPYYDFLSTKALDDALAEYRNFDIASYGGGCFGRYFAMFQNRLFQGSDNGQKGSALWLNLFKLNEGMLPMIDSPYCESVLKLQGNIFRQELDALKPDAVVFLTGPSYDWVIQEFYPDAKCVPLEDHKQRHLARIVADGLPDLTFRTYHPAYVNRQQPERIRWYEEVIQRIKGSFD